MSVRTDAVDIQNRDYNLINTELTEDELDQYIEQNKDLMTRTRWEDMATYQNLSQNFMKSHIKKLPLSRVSTYQPMTEDTIDFFLNYISTMEDASEPKKKKLSRLILQHQDVTEILLRKYKDTIEWTTASIYCNMSEDFIKEMKFYVNWEAICKYKVLSIEFMNEMMDYLYYRNAFFYQNTNNELDQIFKEKINTYDDYFQAFYVRKNYIRDRDESYWRNIIKNYKTYPSDYSDDYFIGYKAIRRDGYSLFSFRDKYERGQTYTTKSDFNDVEVSFGFGIYNRNKAYYYGMQKDNKRFDIVALQVPYRAITFISDNYVFPKVRSSEITILHEDPEYYRYDD